MAEQTPRQRLDHEHPEAEREAYTPPEARVRDEDLEPHAGLRYIARLFKILAILLVLLLLGEVVVGLVQEGAGAIPTLVVEATRLVVFAAFLWAAGDLALMLIDSNHDLRATRILVGRLNSKMGRFLGDETGGAERRRDPAARAGGSDAPGGPATGPRGSTAGAPPNAAEPATSHVEPPRPPRENF